MNDHQINCFLAVADSGSFTEAAKRFRISQPAISRIISSLENELGVSLFERQTRTIFLTPAGQLFFDAFRQSKNILAEAAKKACVVSSVSAGEIRLGVLAGLDLSSYILNIEEYFIQHYPNIQLHSVFLDFDELKDALKTSSVDGIITVEDSLRHMDQEELKIQVLSESQQILLYAKNHPLADCDNLTPFDFRKENFLVVRNKDLNTENLVQQYCAGYGFSPKITLVPNVDSLIAGVQNLAGVGIVDGHSRVRHNTLFRYLELQNINHLVLAWLTSNQNPLLQIFYKFL